MAISGDAAGESSGPLVSVIIPAYNAEQFLARTLASVIAQTHRNLEILVVDDGSTDATSQIVQRYAAQDARIKLIQQNNAGVAAARNRGIEQARGEFIAPLDADDIWFPDCIAAQLSQMTSPRVGLVHAWSVFIDEADRLMSSCQSQRWQGGDFVPLVYRNLPGNASCVLVRRQYAQLVGGYDPSHRAQNAQGCEDWDFYLRLAERFEVRTVPRLLVGYRQVTGSMSSNLLPMKRGLDLVLDAVAKRHPSLNPAIYRWSLSNFYCYLALKNSQMGNHCQTLVCLQRALRLDHAPLLQVSAYRLGGGSLVKLCLQPVARRIGSDQSAWRRFRSRVAEGLRRVNPWYQPLTLATLEQRQVRDHQRFLRRQYERFLTRRFDRLRQQSQPSDRPPGLENRQRYQLEVTLPGKPPV
ncbi:MAG: glycosyltransferase family A protein [Cyanobacteria bacterium J06648_16]